MTEFDADGEPIYPTPKLPKTREETLALADYYTWNAESLREDNSCVAPDFELLALMLRRRGNRMKRRPS